MKIGLVLHVLFSPERELTDHVEIELLLEAYYADFEEIVADIKTVKVSYTISSELRLSTP